MACCIGIWIIIIIGGATGIAPAIAGAGHVAIIAAAERRRRDQAEREGEGAAQQSCHVLVLSRRRNRRTCPSKCSRGVEFAVTGVGRGVRRYLHQCQESDGLETNTRPEERRGGKGW